VAAIDPWFDETLIERFLGVLAPLSCTRATPYLLMERLRAWLCHAIVTLGRRLLLRRQSDGKGHVRETFTG
jgi:hypothetical protein